MEYFLLFTAGLLSSIHCIGMCGCFVSAYSVNIKGSNLQKSFSHLLYSFGRITTYTFLGAIMGSLGSSIYFISKFANIQNYITIFFGCLMLYLGFSTIGIVPKIGIIQKSESLFIRSTRKLFVKLMKTQGRFFTFPLGVTLGFLPCCLLYTVELQAMSTGSPVKGALSMFSFGLGTIPSMFSIGILANLISNKTKMKLANLSGYVIILLGAASIYRAVYT